MTELNPIIVLTDPKFNLFYASMLECNEEILLLPLDAAGRVNDLKCDLIILDCGLENERGVTWLKTLKQHRPDLPVIFITGASNEQTAVSAFKSGAREYFSKPFHLFELQDAIREILHLKRGTDNGKNLAPDVEAYCATYTTNLRETLPDRLIRALAYIEEHYLAEIPLEKLAESACLSKYHFCRKFKHYTGMSPKQFIIHLRLEKARQFMAKPDVTITSAAFMAGFNDINAFNRQFRIHYGITPSNYRRSLNSIPAPKE